MMLQSEEFDRKLYEKFKTDRSLQIYGYVKMRHFALKYIQKGGVDLLFYFSLHKKRHLGNGGFGSVYIANPVLNDHINESVRYAAKLYSHEHKDDEKTCLSNRKLDNSVRKQIEHEAYIMRLKTDLDPKIFIGGCMAVLLMNYVPGDTLVLNHMPHPEIKQFTFYRLMDLLIKIALEVAKLHAGKPSVAHKDVTGSNIKFYTDEQDVLRVKLLDFGLSQVVPTNPQNTNAVKKIEGTAGSIGPEVSFGCREGQLTDIYALGMLFMRLLVQINTKDEVKKILKNASAKKLNQREKHQALSKMKIKFDTFLEAWSIPEEYKSVDVVEGLKSLVQRMIGPYENRPTAIDTAVTLCRYCPRMLKKLTLDAQEHKESRMWFYHYWFYSRKDRLTEKELAEGLRFKMNSHTAG